MELESESLPNHSRITIVKWILLSKIIRDLASKIALPLRSIRSLIYKEVINFFFKKNVDKTVVTERKDGEHFMIW